MTVTTNLQSDAAIKAAQRAGLALKGEVPPVVRAALEAADLSRIAYKEAAAANLVGESHAHPMSSNHAFIGQCSSSHSNTIIAWFNKIGAHAQNQETAKGVCK